MPLLPPPDQAPPDPAAAWRTEVGLFRTAQPRRSFPLTVHVGVPLGRRHELDVPWPMPSEYDAGLRFDLMDALLGEWLQTGGGDAFTWLTRPGVPELHDTDQLWHSAASHAFAAHGLELRGFLALTRTGWVDVRTGERRVWRRLRL